jgi:protein-tyrosine-phosphatase/N-acetylglutamate synthase-like GNAT family acetyltransferase
MKTVIFACVHNAGRSQMAAALFNRYADPGRATAISAGTRPGPRVFAEVTEAMGEIGIDLGEAVPQLLSEELAGTASVLVTMGCGEACPGLPGVERHDWPLEDPKGKPIERVRAIRNDVRDRVRALIARNGWARDPAGAPSVALTLARKEDEGDVRALLEASQLPVGGLELAFPAGYVVARATQLVGSAGLEVHEGDALLRSVAVSAAGRHHGLGVRLVENRLEAARLQSLRAVYLITTTAAAFFMRLGFLLVDRAEVPEGIRRSAEFASLCPSSAVVLRRPLR